MGKLSERHTSAKKIYSLCTRYSNVTEHSVLYLVALTENDCLKSVGGGKLQDRAEWDENEENPRDQGFQSCLERWKDRGQGRSRRSIDWGRGQSVWPYRDRHQAPSDESLDHSFLDIKPVYFLK